MVSKRNLVFAVVIALLIVAVSVLVGINYLGSKTPEPLSSKQVDSVLGGDWNASSPSIFSHPYANETTSVLNYTQVNFTSGQGNFIVLIMQFHNSSDANMEYNAWNFTPASNLNQSFHKIESPLDGFQCLYVNYSIKSNSNSVSNNTYIVGESHDYVILIHAQTYYFSYTQAKNLMKTQISEM